jgi:hypothetical protein
MGKTFKGGLDSLIGGAKAQPKKSPKAEVSAPKKPGRPRTTKKIPYDTTEQGTLPGEKRATFIVKEEQLEKLKAVAYWDRTKIKDVITAALEKYLDAYEKKNGPIKKVK